MSDLLDWQITDAPDPDQAFTPISDAPTAPYPARSLPALSRRATRGITLILGGVIVLALMSAGMYWAWNRAQVQAAIQHIVALENKALQTGDWEALYTLAAEPENIYWQDEIYSIPPPVPFVLPDWKGEVRAITAVESNRVRADIAYPYRAGDGATLTFIREQFYRYANGEWKRAALPDDRWNDTRAYQSVYFNAGYPAVDEAWLKPALLEVEAQLARICAIWPCAEIPEIKLSFSRESTASYHDPIPESALYQFFVTAEGYERTLTWPALRQSGYPADEATARRYQRALTLNLFQRLTNQVISQSELKEGGWLARALALRLATRLGLESFPLNEVRVVSPLYSIAELWATPADTGPRRDSYPDLTLRAALVAVNRLLHDQPPEAEDRLLAALFDATDAVDWVARGLHISQYEAQLKLAELEQADAPRVNVLTTQPGTFTFSCGGGLYAYSLGEGAPSRLLDGAYLSANAYSWSPDQRRLLVELNGRMGVVNFDSQTMAWLPPNIPDLYAPIRWANATTLIFLGYSDNYAPDLHFIDLAQPERQWPVLENTLDYISAPDNSAAIVVQSVTDSLNPRLALLTSFEDTPQRIGEGQFLAWSPDSQHIAYLWHDQLTNEFALHLVDVSTGATQDLLTAADLFADTAKQVALDYSPWVTAQWAPDGQRLAVTLSAYHVNEPYTWAGLIHVKSPGQWEAIPIERQGNSHLAGFSADGEWLAMVSYGDTSVITQLYSTTTGQRVRSLDNFNFNGWSPTGHQLALSDFSSTLYWLKEPGQLTEAPTPLTDAPCLSLMWNPNP